MLKKKANGASIGTRGTLEELPEVISKISSPEGIEVTKYSLSRLPRDPKILEFAVRKGKAIRQ